MRRVLCLALLVAACGGGADSAEPELAAATFVIEVDATELEVVGTDRFAVGTGDENRLDVLRPGGSFLIIPIYTAPVPDPFEFVRDPLRLGAVEPLLEGADRVLAVLYPLVDSTPGGRVLAGSLVALDSHGNLIGTDWGEDGDRRTAELLQWAAPLGVDPVRAIELAVRGIAGVGELPDGAREAAAFFR